MNNINYEITFYNSPFYQGLIEELIEVSRKKKNILNKINSQDELHSKLVYHDKELLKHCSEKENQILLKIIEHKGWFVNQG